MAWEAAAAPAEAAGIRVPRIRTGIVLDADGGALQRLARLCRFGILGKLGTGKQWMSWISLADEVAAIRFLLDPDCELRGPVNLTAPAPVTNEVFTKALGPRAAPADVPPGAELRPEAAARLRAGRGRCSTRASGCSPTCCSTPGFEFRHTDLEPTLRELLR